MNICSGNKIYEEYFNHVKQLQIVILITGGRTGSDFFQSLTDGHTEILQLPGIFQYHCEFWIRSVCKSNLNDLINEFVYHPNHISKFKSIYNKMERWDQLGEGKNECFEVDIVKFKEHLFNIMENRPINSKNFFIAIHIAYALTIGSDVFKTKILLYHLHHMERLAFFKDDFPDFFVIYTVRDPRNNLVSGIDNWRLYDDKKYTSAHLYAYLNRIIEEIFPVQSYCPINKIKTLPLENLHKKSKDVMQEFCNDFGLTFQDCLLYSTYHGKQWWGDLVSQKYLKGFNRNIDAIKWNGKFFLYEEMVLEFILYPRLNHYGYKIFHNQSVFSYLLIPLMIVCPMKYEIAIFTHGFTNSKLLRTKARILMQSFSHYFLRVLLYYRYFYKRLNKSLVLPDFYGNVRNEHNH